MHPNLSPFKESGKAYFDFGEISLQLGSAYSSSALLGVL